jgi:Protein of unknown function (DUF2970)
MKPGHDFTAAELVAHRRTGSWLRTIKAVAWSFVGLRKGSEFEQDTQKLNPIHVIVVGLAGAAVFVLGLAFFVQWAVVAAK